MSTGIIEAARAQGRTLLNEVEAKQLLEQAGVPVSPARLARTEDEAAAMADEIGYPAVLKIVSPQITHKSDVGGVELNLASRDDVAAAFERILASVKQHAPDATVEGVAVQRMEQPGIEVIVGMTKDPQFGPVMMFGLGGVLVEVLKDVAFRVVPIEERDARQMIEEIKGYPVLEGYRGRDPADVGELRELLLQVSRFIEEHPDVEELDLNPVFAYKDGAIAVEARVVLSSRVAGVALFTSGFAETGEEEGIRLQEQLLQIARDGDVSLIGPNCMGLYNRRLGIRQSAEQGAGDAGDVGFISQSGTHAINFGLVGEQHGVRISTSVSIGNAIVLDVPDYLDYLADDPETKVIAMYIEGVKDGPRFVRSLKRATSMKPVVVWKGGVTDAGARATASHTGSLATSNVVFSSIVRQAGALEADSLDDTIDVVKALLYAKAGTGRRMGLMAMTGGQSVVITDAFVRAGLDVPRLSAASYKQLGSFFNLIGGSYQNPLDMGGTIGFGGSAETLAKLCDILDADANVDAIAMEMASGFLARRWAADPASLDQLLDVLVAHRDRSSKPFVAMLQSGHVEEIAIQARKRVQERGLPVFASFERAARALRRSVEYQRFRGGVG